MFTGLIKRIGKIEQLKHFDPGVWLQISFEAWEESLEQGESIAVNGVCLSIVEPEELQFWACLSPETLKRSSLGSLKAESAVNLERALRAQDRLGGHYVQGHVDDVGKVLKIEKLSSFYRILLEIPQQSQRYIIEKGSIAVDGVSLTINQIPQKNQIELMIIPETWSNTIFSYYRTGSVVNLEYDVMAKHIEKILRTQKLEKFL